MSSPSVSQPAGRRRVPALRHHRTVQLSPAASRRVRQLSPAKVWQGQAQSARAWHGHDEETLADRRAHLEARWRDRVERITAVSLAYYEETQRGMPETATGQAETSRRARLLACQAVAERQALAEIEAALDRLAAGRYGWCEQCGRPIGGAVLTAHPQARYCGACGPRPAQRPASAG